MKKVLFISFLSLSAVLSAQVNLNKAKTAVKKVTKTVATPALSEADIINGLKEALSKGSNQAATLASAAGGFSNNSLIKIPFPQDAKKMEFVLQKEKQEAERKRVEAQGIADYQRIISTGLNDKQLQYEQIQMMKGLITSPNSKVIVMGKGNTPVILDSKDK